MTEEKALTRRELTEDRMEFSEKMAKAYWKLIKAKAVIKGNLEEGFRIEIEPQFEYIQAMDDIVKSALEKYGQEHSNLCNMCKVSMVFRQ